MIVLDASVLIAFLNADDAHHGAATDLVVTAAAEPLGTGAVTLSEVLVGPTRNGTASSARRSLDPLDLMVAAVDATSVDRLAALRVRTGLKLPDCCVLLAAEDVGAHTVLTFDARLRAEAAEAGYRTDP